MTGVYTALKLSPKTLCILGRRLLGLLFMYSRHGTYSQATPGLLNACVTGCNEYDSKQLQENRTSTLVFSIYWIM